MERDKIPYHSYLRAVAPKLLLQRHLLLIELLLRPSTEIFTPIASKLLNFMYDNNSSKIAIKTKKYNYKAFKINLNKNSFALT